METTNHDIYKSPTRDMAVGQFMSKVYLWMTAGIFTTAIVSRSVSMNDEWLMAIMQNRFLFFLLVAAQFGLVIWLSAGMKRLTAINATLIFLFYSALTGITFSVFTLIYTQESIQSAFFTTTFAFAGLSAFGMITKRDLGPVGAFCTMGLFGLIGFALLSLFFPAMMSSSASQIFGIVGVLVFSGLTAYDTQVIKRMAPLGAGDVAIQKAAIMGALKLYLDFINLFLSILRLTGRRR